MGIDVAGLAEAGDWEGPGSATPLDIPVDLFVAEPFSFGPAYEKAAKAELFPGVVVPVVPLELLLAMKKAAGRPKDQEDIRVLRELHPNAPEVH